MGSLTAILMAKKGLNVEVYENRDDIREAQFIGGKSINLACSNRGWAALEAADIAKEIMGVAIPMYGRRMHPVEGEMTYQSYGKEEEAKSDPASKPVPDKAPEAKPAPSKDKKGDDEVGPQRVEFGSKNDYQLLQAMNLLKGLAILQAKP